MGADEKDASTLTLSCDVVLVAALGGYLWSQVPLNSVLERLEAVVEQRAGSDLAIAARANLFLEDIEGMRPGAFAHWSQQPLFQVLLLPSGRICAMALLEYFLTQ